MFQKIGALLVIVIVACNNPVNTTQTTDSTSTNRTNTPVEKSSSQKNDFKEKSTPKNNGVLANCYMQVLVRDTFVAHLQQNGNIVTGILSLDNFEKDGSTGTVSGVLDGDVLKLLYSFQSEGMSSKMDVYYKLTDEGLVRGVGEMNVRGDKSYFTNPATVQYNRENNLLKKIACKEVPAKYK